MEVSGDDYGNVTSDDSSSVSSISDYSVAWDLDKSPSPAINSKTSSNLAINYLNRQIYGHCTRNKNAKAAILTSKINVQRTYTLDSLLKRNRDRLSHIYMGFTLCGQYFLSYTQCLEDNYLSFISPLKYEIYIWRFIPGSKLKFVSKHEIFNFVKSSGSLDIVKFMQFPNDMSKIVCYGYSDSSPDLCYISLLTLPTPSNCIHCTNNFTQNGEFVRQGWCTKHGFIIHYMITMTQPSPTFDPNISLAFHDHLVINSGHHIHILNVSTSEQNSQAKVSLAKFMEVIESKAIVPNSANCLSDTFSEASESASDNFGCSNIVDAILEDFNEYDLESNDGNKPFHELNISCEPLNVTGKSYHSTLIQNNVDTKIKGLQNSSKEYLFSRSQSSLSVSEKPPEKPKIDKKIAEKAYEFTEENEKYEKISLFRKKRLADKKYEFSDDNTENIVPFHTVRRERSYLYRSSQGRSIKSPDFNPVFLSPRSTEFRSPMLSPNSRCGQLSPIGLRHTYATTSLRYSPYYSKSPISPKEATRKMNVYSPSLDSDCSDSESRLMIKHPTNSSTSSHYPPLDYRSNNNGSGLLIVDPKFDMDGPKWINKVVRRFSNDYETSSLLSGRTRDDFNNPIELPLIVQSLSDQSIDLINHTSDRQIVVTQRSLDCEQFVQKHAQMLCLQTHLEFLHCDDYNINVIYVCPVNGEMLCQAVIKIGALKLVGPQPRSQRPENYWTRFLFIWNIITDAFNVIECESEKFYSENGQFRISNIDYPKFNCHKAWVLTCNGITKSSLSDPNNHFKIRNPSGVQFMYAIDDFNDNNDSDDDDSIEMSF